MNAHQASRIARLLRDAEHPKTCPITGQRYTPEELAEFIQPYGEPTASVVGYVSDRRALADGAEVLEFRLNLGTLQSASELYLHPDGRLLTWSTVRIPPEDLDCECDDPSFSHTPPGSDEARASCPVHGSGIRELDCWRVANVGWEIRHRKRAVEARREWLGGHAVVTLPAHEELGPPYWAFAVREGDPLVDPLPAYRADRAAAR